MGIEEDLIQLLDKHDNESLKEALRNHNPHRAVAPDKNIIVYEQKSSMAENIIYIMLVFVMIAVGFAFYLYMQVDKKNGTNSPVYATYEEESKDITFDDLPEDEKSMYILKSIVDKQNQDREELTKKLTVMANKKITFDNLPKEEQDNYISKKVVDEQFDLLKKQYENDIKNIEDSISVKQVENKIDIPYTYIFDDEVISTPKQKAYALLRCYDMGAGKSEVTRECKEKIKLFVNEHKDAKLFKVAGVIGQEDKDIVEDNKYKKFTLLGLAQNRANEIAWYMKKVVKNKIPIQSLSYATESKKVSKGIMIRAYK